MPFGYCGLRFWRGSIRYRAKRRVRACFRVFGRNELRPYGIANGKESGAWAAAEESPRDASPPITAPFGHSATGIKSNTGELWKTADRHQGRGGKLRGRHENRRALCVDRRAVAPDRTGTHRTARRSSTGLVADQLLRPARELVQHVLPPRLGRSAALHQVLEQDASMPAYLAKRLNFGPAIRPQVRDGTAGPPATKNLMAVQVSIQVSSGFLSRFPGR